MSVEVLQAADFFVIRHLDQVCLNYEKYQQSLRP